MKLLSLWFLQTKIVCTVNQSCLVRFSQGVLTISLSNLLLLSYNYHISSHKLLFPKFHFFFWLFVTSVDCSLPDSSVHGILQAKILEWVAILFSRGSYQLREWTWVSNIADRSITVWATREPKELSKPYQLMTVILWLWLREVDDARYVLLNS